MYFPTIEHEKYIDYMKSICNQNQLSLILKGSLAHGTAKKFSDIDLLLCGKMSASLLDQMISGFDKIVMTNQTENPKGIYILNYENGISVDLDIRQSVLSSDISNNLVLCDYGFEITDNIKRRVITSDYMPERPEWYKTIRLIHRCCVKYLCGKMDIAQGLADEVSMAVFNVTNQRIAENESMEKRMKEAFFFLSWDFSIDQNIRKLMEELFCVMREMDA